MRLERVNQAWPPREVTTVRIVPLGLAILGGYLGEALQPGGHAWMLTLILGLLLGGEIQYWRLRLWQRTPG